MHLRLIILLIVLLALVYALIPSIECGPSNGHVRLLVKAVVEYNAANGHYPEMLTDAQRYLRNGTITRINGDEYKAEIDGGNGRIYLLEAKYKRDASGIMDFEYARVIDYRRK